MSFYFKMSIFLYFTKVFTFVIICYVGLYLTTRFGFQVNELVYLKFYFTVQPSYLHSSSDKRILCGDNAQKYHFIGVYTQAVFLR